MAKATIESQYAAAIYYAAELLGLGHALEAVINFVLRKFGLLGETLTTSAVATAQLGVASGGTLIAGTTVNSLPQVSDLPIAPDVQNGYVSVKITNVWTNPETGEQAFRSTQFEFPFNDYPKDLTDPIVIDEPITREDTFGGSHADWIFVESQIDYIFRGE